jgi:hypothetical protein
MEFPVVAIRRERVSAGRECSRKVIANSYLETIETQADLDAGVARYGFCGLVRAF